MLERPTLVSRTESRQMRTHKISSRAASSSLRAGNDPSQLLSQVLLILILLHFRDSHLGPRSHLSHLRHLSQLSQLSRFSQATNNKTKPDAEIEAKTEAKAKVRAKVLLG